MLKDQLDVTVARADGQSGQAHDFELALAASHAKLDAQQGMVTELRAYLDARERLVEGKAG